MFCGFYLYYVLINRFLHKREFLRYDFRFFRQIQIPNGCVNKILNHFGQDDLKWILNEVSHGQRWKTYPNKKTNNNQYCQPISPDMECLIFDSVQSYICILIVNMFWNIKCVEKPTSDICCYQSVRCGIWNNFGFPLVFSFIWMKCRSQHSTCIEYVHSDKLLTIINQKAI